MSQAWIPIVKLILKKSLDLGHFLRSVVWYTRSAKEYTRSAFLEKAKTFKSFDDVNISGRSFMILGASGTVGTAVASYLVKKDGVTLHVVYNKPEHGNSLITTLKSISHKNSTIVPHKVDFTRPGEVYKFVLDFVALKPDLHVLINCATIMSAEDIKDVYGTRLSFLVNVLSPLIICTMISDYMSTLPIVTYKRRIINCTCGCILTVNIHINDIELNGVPFKSMFHYSHEKKQTAVVLHQMALKYSNIQYSNVIPGWVKRDIQSDEIPEPAESWRKDLRLPEEGADTILWLAISNESIKIPSGEIFLDRNIYKLSYMNIPNYLRTSTYGIYSKSLRKVVDRYSSLKESTVVPPEPVALKDESKEHAIDASTKPEDAVHHK
ncbi:Dehydrogenase/reductase SDR family member 12 [Thelohanellus kitauei]|uniref:Dehydrogenase/reductase SDR family member 12 n=1 Tax=Thelohanellus kitauei TaxID=669202 RepID=A0A0C2M8W9_THEKT|nr:Dehydrogenase/reductase SDR family member 12 [Thelohanellus kitauei]